MDSLDFAIVILSSIGGGFSAVLAYSDLKHEWLSYWPFGVVPILCFAVAFTIYIARKNYRESLATRHLPS